MLPRFVKDHYDGLTVDELVDALKTDKLDRYQIMSRFAVYLKRDFGKSDDRTRKMIMQTKLFLEHSGIEFSERAFRSRVKLPRAIARRQKTAVDRETIISILQAASNQPNLQLCILWHAATGRRPSEIFSLRHCDLDLERRRYRIRPEFSKMRPGDLLFGPYRWDGYKGRRASPAMLYFLYTQMLRDLIDSMQNGAAERVSPDNPMAPRRFTLYRLRDHAKTVISDLGYSDFSEWFLAHSGSTYYQQTEKKRAEIFAKVEPSLTYLDTLQLEGRRASMESQLAQQQEDYRKLAHELTQLQEQNKFLYEQFDRILRKRNFDTLRDKFDKAMMRSQSHDSRLRRESP